MKLEIYWTKGKQNKDILSQRFYKELEQEIEFFEKYRFIDQVNILNRIKINIANYDNVASYKTTQLSTEVSRWNNLMKFAYATAQRTRKIKEYIATDVIRFRDPLYVYMTNQNKVVLSDVEMIIYCDLVLEDKFSHEKIKEYKNLIDTNYKNLSDFVEESRNVLETNQAQFDRKVVETEEEYEKKIQNLIINKNEEIQSLKDEIVNTMEEQKKEMERLESNYYEKLKFDEPSKFWEEKSNEYRKEKKLWILGAIAAIILLLISIFFISAVLFDLQYNSKTLNIVFTGFGQNVTLGNVVIVASIESIIIYVLRVCLKYYDYNIKLQEFYKSKSMLSSFYVTIKDDISVDNEIIRHIYRELFTMREIKGEEIPSSGLSGFSIK
ncbi:DUF6161 domain-containing protein [Mollicutes bacterium LVI A0039]|nr:DUF6161 domain-containing protein [Mollicutes bacterium LVI A0039]